MTNAVDNDTAALRPSAITAQVLEIVAEQTGYPAGLLDMALELDADLGIDSVKQAELFAIIRETYGIESDDNVQPRDYPTLNALVDFVVDHGH